MGKVEQEDAVPDFDPTHTAAPDASPPAPETEVDPPQFPDLDGTPRPLDVQHAHERLAQLDKPLPIKIETTIEVFHNGFVSRDIADAYSVSGRLAMPLAVARKFLRDTFEYREERLPDGNLVKSNLDVYRWFLWQVAEQIPPEVRKKYESQ